MRAKYLGAAPLAAIESVVRVVGRMVVCVDAAADVNTAMISSLSSGEPSTSVPSRPSASPDSSPARRSTPA